MNISWRAAAALPGAAVIGLLAGGVTAYLQGVLSQDWNTIANSGAVWTVVAVAVAAALTRARWVAVAAGLLVLVGEVAGYYLYIADVRQLPVWVPAALLWTIAALWVGPLAGLAAYYVRAGDPARRCAALVALCGVIAGEGGYLIRVAGVPRAGAVEIVVGGLGAFAALLALPGAPRGRVGAAGAGVLAGAVVYAAYAQPVFW